MRGQKSETDKLERAMTALVFDNEIRDFVRKFQEVRTELVNESAILRTQIDRLRTLVDGGERINTPGDCDLAACQPFPG